MSALEALAAAEKRMLQAQETIERLRAQNEQQDAALRDISLLVRQLSDADISDTKRSIITEQIHNTIRAALEGRDEP